MSNDPYLRIIKEVRVKGYKGENEMGSLTFLEFRWLGDRLVFITLFLDLDGMLFGGYFWVFTFDSLFLTTCKYSKFASGFQLMNPLVVALMVRGLGERKRFIFPGRKAHIFIHTYIWGKLCEIGSELISFWGL